MVGTFRLFFCFVQAHRSFHDLLLEALGQIRLQVDELLLRNLFLKTLASRPVSHAEEEEEKGKASREKDIGNRIKEMIGHDPRPEKGHEGYGDP